MKYKELVLSSLPFIYSTLEETSGTVATDYSGNAINGTYSTAANPTFNPLVYRGADTSSFVGRTATYSVNSQFWDADADSFSIEGWYYAKTLTTSNPLVTRGTNNSITVNPEGVTFSVTTTAGTETVFAAVDQKRSHYFVATYAAGIISLYVDGELIGGKALDGVLSATGNTTVVVGNTTDPIYISHIALYKTTLSAAFVAQHYYGATIPNYEDIVVTDGGQVYDLDDNSTDVGFNILESDADALSTGLTDLYYQDDGLVIAADLTEGIRETYYDLNDIGVIDGSRINWVEQGDVLVETSLDAGATWVTATNNAPVPTLVEGYNATDKLLGIRITLTAGTVVPKFKYLHFIIYTDKSPRNINVDELNATITEPVTLAENALGPAQNTEWSYAKLGGGTLVVPTPPAGKPILGLEMWVRFDSLSNSTIVPGVLTLTSGGTLTPAGTTAAYLNGVSGAMTVVAGKWYHLFLVFAGRTTGFTFQGDISLRFPAIYYNAISTNKILTHYNYGYGGSTASVIDSAPATLSEVSYLAYAHTWELASAT